MPPFRADLSQIFSTVVHVLQGIVERDSERCRLKAPGALMGVALERQLQRAPGVFQVIAMSAWQLFHVEDFDAFVAGVVQGSQKSRITGDREASLCQSDTNPGIIQDLSQRSSV